jgi:hypothetical protein
LRGTTAESRDTFSSVFRRVTSSSKKRLIFSENCVPGGERQATASGLYDISEDLSESSPQIGADREESSAASPGHELEKKRVRRRSHMPLSDEDIYNEAENESATTKNKRGGNFSKVLKRELVNK